MSDTANRGCDSRQLWLPRQLASKRTWTDRSLADESIAVTDIPFVTIGGGLGSLAMVQVLRIAGVPASEIGVLSDIELPHETFRRLAEASQIGPNDRLRSASDARMDCIWGWPGYALQEAIGERRVRPLWEVLTEPILSEYFTPRATDVYGSIEREAHRLRWTRILSKGLVRTIRRRAGGGYFVMQEARNPIDGWAVFRCAHAHVAVGHSVPRLLPELLAYRRQYPDCGRLVQAYEPHEHIYEQVRARPATVVVRGAGIVASRVLQRLFDDRELYGTQTDVIHVLRTPVSGPSGPVLFRRDGGEGFSYQAFNYPKAAFGGQLKVKLEGMAEQDRLTLIQSMGSTSTSRRMHWRRQIEDGAGGGWYRQQTGTVGRLRRSTDGLLLASIRMPDGRVVDLNAHFMIDATGLENELATDPFLADLVECTGGQTNSLGQLDVEPTFEVRGTRSGLGYLYASGARTLGGSYAPVDSFLGLQYAALRIGDDLARLGFCRRIGAARSLNGWWRWIRGAAP